MTSFALPDRSPFQRAAALERANRVRRLRAEMKADLTLERGSRLIARPPWWLRTMKVDALLRELPGYGPRRTAKTLRVVAIAPGKTVGGLSGRQRTDLARRVFG